MNVNDVKALADRMRVEIAKGVVGQSDTIDLMLTAMLARPDSRPSPCICMAWAMMAGSGADGRGPVATARLRKLK